MPETTGYSIWGGYKRNEDNRIVHSVDNDNTCDYLSHTGSGYDPGYDEKTQTYTTSEGEAANTCFGEWFLMGLFAGMLFSAVAVILGYEDIGGVFGLVGLLFGAPVVRVIIVGIMILLGIGRQT